MSIKRFGVCVLFAITLVVLALITGFIMAEWEVHYGVPKDVKFIVKVLDAIPEWVIFLIVVPVGIAYWLITGHPIGTTGITKNRKSIWKKDNEE